MATRTTYRQQSSLVKSTIMDHSLCLLVRIDLFHCSPIVLPLPRAVHFDQITSAWNTKINLPPFVSWGLYSLSVFLWLWNMQHIVLSMQAQTGSRLLCYILSARLGCGSVGLHTWWGFLPFDHSILSLTAIFQTLHTCTCQAMKIKHRTTHRARPHRAAVSPLPSPLSSLPVWSLSPSQHLQSHFQHWYLCVQYIYTST